MIRRMVNVSAPTVSTANISLTCGKIAVQKRGQRGLVHFHRYSFAGGPLCATGKCNFTPKGGRVEDEILKVDVTDGIARLVMNRPAKLNALSDAMLAALTERLTTLAADPDVRVIILAGAGKAFCAGHDLKEMQGRARGPLMGVRPISTTCSPAAAR